MCVYVYTYMYMCVYVYIFPMEHLSVTRRSQSLAQSTQGCTCYACTHLIQGVQRLIYTCMYKHTYIYIHVYVYIFKCIHCGACERDSSEPEPCSVNTGLRVLCMYSFDTGCTAPHINMYAYTHIYIHTCTRIYIYMYSP